MPTIDTFVRELRHSARVLGKKPSFTLIAVLTLALAIGANTAIFSLINAVLLRPLQYPEPDRLMWLSERGRDLPVMSISYPDFADWCVQQTVFEHIGLYNHGNYTLTGRGEPQRLNSVRMSAGAFAALGVPAALGRVFNVAEDKPGSPPVAVLSHELWQNRFAGDAGIVGESITLDGHAYTVIGVMPAEFAFPSRADLWTPVGPLSTDPIWQQRGNHPGLFGVGRLKPGATLEQARAGIDAVAAQLERQYPDSNRNIRVSIEPLLDTYVSNARAALWTLLGAVGLVLLVACGNVANLLLARAVARQREMAVRAALGASRSQIVRQLLLEGLLLATAGAVLGLLLAKWGVSIALWISPGAVPRADEIGLDARVLAFTATLAMLTGLMFGLAPAWRASGADLQDVLRSATQGTTRTRVLMHQSLVVAELALTLVLLVGATLLLRSFYHLQQVNAGFTYERVLTFRLDLPTRKYATGERQIAFYQGLIERLRALPGVQAVGVASQFPLGHSGFQAPFLVEGQPVPPPNERPFMEYTLASPDYFRALGIHLLRGRYFTEQDNREHLRGRDLSGLNDIERLVIGLNVVIVDEEFARRHWPNVDPIGKRIRMPWGPLPTQQLPLTVVGVVARVKLVRLNEQNGFVQAYLPALQASLPAMAVAMKTTVEPETVVAAMRQQVVALDPEQPIYDVSTLTERRDRSLASERLNLTLLGSFAAFGLLLAAIGLYGVISYAVTQRTREIGLRMALGAQRGNVLTLVLRQGMQLALIGVLVGLGGSWALTRLLQTLLFAVSATDPPTFALTAFLLTFVALLACWFPARRATKVDPMVALRCD
jgi:putative ABC transport system permease protein